MTAAGLGISAAGEIGVGIRGVPACGGAGDITSMGALRTGTPTRGGIMTVPCTVILVASGDPGGSGRGPAPGAAAGEPGPVLLAFCSGDGGAPRARAA